MAALKHIGIEINDGSVRYVELKKKKEDFELGAYGETALPEGVIDGGAIRQGIDLEKILRAVRKKGGFTDATISHLPDQVFLADIMKEAGFQNIYMEPAGESLSQSCLPFHSKEAVIFVYFTGRSVNIYAGSQGNMKLLATHPFKNELFAKTLDKEMIFSFLKEKIDEQYVSWHTHKDEQGKARPKIGKIIFVGEFQDLPELAQYLGRHLKVRTELGEAWTNIFSFERHIPEINFRDSLRYAAAIGLALRPFEK